MELTLDALATLVGGKVTGDGSTLIRGINGLKEACAGEISFLANPRYERLLDSTRASAVIVADGVRAPIPSIHVKNPDLAFARVAERFTGAPLRLKAGIHPAAVVARGAKIGREVSIGAHAVIEEGASVGEGTVIYPQVYVGHGAQVGRECLLYPQVVIREKCVLGDRVILHSGVAIGCDGFGFTTEEGVHKKIPQTGIVVVEDDVEIGANSAISRARFGQTVVHKGAKLDNLVHLAHNVVVGEGCLVAAQTGIAGSTKLGKYVMLGGQAGLGGHIELGDGVIVTAQAGVAKSFPPGVQITGHHAIESKKYFRQLAALSRLPEALAEIRRLKREVEELRKKLKE